MTSTTQELPDELKQHIQGKLHVLGEELIIDGQIMTVAQVAQGFRNQKVKANIFAVMAGLLAVLLVFNLYWHAEHPIEKIVAVVPVK